MPRQPGGALEPHQRGKAVATYPGAEKWCAGGGKAPRRGRTPFFSRLARFTLGGEQAECPSCRQTVRVYRAAEQGDPHPVRYRRHDGHDGYATCGSSFEGVPDGVRVTSR